MNDPEQYLAVCPCGRMPARPAGGLQTQEQAINRARGHNRRSAARGNVCLAHVIDHRGAVIWRDPSLSQRLAAIEQRRVEGLARIDRAPDGSK